MTALAWLLWQDMTGPVGPAGWTLRNWLGLGCQVVVFVLLVAFIFWLADLGEREGDPTAAGGAPPPSDSPSAGSAAPPPPAAPPGPPAA
jgi:hypothetical protein